MNIQLRGPFFWFWVVWHAARLFILGWGGYLSVWHGFTQELHLAIAILYTSFLPAELLGAYFEKNDPPGVEVARTLSQTNQWIANKGGRFGKWIASMSGAIDAAFVIMLISPLNVFVAIVAGGLLGWRLMPHYAVRGDVG